MDYRLVRHLMYFLTVAEERHFGRAAERLGISQPPLSNQIKVLEHALGVQLLDRSRNGVRLTPEGQAILPHLQRFADHARRLENAVTEAKNGRSLNMVIGAVTSAMFSPLGPTIRELRNCRPDLNISLIEMDSSDALSALENEEIDVAFVRANRVWAPLEVLPLFEDQLVVALPDNHPLLSENAVSLPMLANERMVLCPRRVSPVYHDQIISACQQAGFSPRIFHEAKSILSQIAFVGCGIGVALVPLSLQNLGTVGVEFRPLLEKVDVITTALAWSKLRKHPDNDLLADIARKSMVK
ncbi:LysR family transcriptional regulator [Pokkaliibacter plantistimulans]|uniref:LysR family transcriptional regulator n=2 Tax=Pseudomonadota TaxID=1224 RepID=A0A2S5KMG6_9PROT|nr:LysR family transcriptional regulator [Pokkaliibacter plantistimulans]